MQMSVVLTLVINKPLTGCWVLAVVSEREGHVCHTEIETHIVHVHAGVVSTCL